MYETRHFTIDFFQMNATSYFQFPAFLLKKSEVSLTSETGIMNTDVGCPKQEPAQT